MGSIPECARANPSLRLVVGSIPECIRTAFPHNSMQQESTTFYSTFYSTVFVVVSLLWFRIALYESHRHFLRGCFATCREHCNTYGIFLVTQTLEPCDMLCYANGAILHMQPLNRRARPSLLKVTRHHPRPLAPRPPPALFLSRCSP